MTIYNGIMITKLKCHACDIPLQPQLSVRKVEASEDEYFDETRFHFEGKLIGYCAACECWTTLPITFSIPIDKIERILLEEKTNDIKTDC